MNCNNCIGRKNWEQLIAEKIEYKKIFLRLGSIHEGDVLKKID